MPFSTLDGLFVLNLCVIFYIFVHGEERCVRMKYKR